MPVVAVAKAVLFGGLFMTAVTWVEAAQAKCRSLPSSQAGKALLSEDNGGVLILGPIVTDGKLPLTWKSMRHLDGHCYAMPEDWRYRQLKFAVNNYLAEPAEQSEPRYRFDLDLQIIKITARPSGEPKEADKITAYRSEKSPWYRNGVPSQRYAGRTKTLDMSVEEWNGAHDPLNVIEQNDRKLGGRFHASPTAQGRNTFEARRWWQLNEKLTDNYTLHLENRLLSAQSATGDIAGGIPFQVNERGYDAIIIRYSSVNADIDNVVTLCFANCDAIAKLKLEASPRHVFASLFRWLQ
jgi:hypothetical protein